ncbi:MAG: YihY family inner membrane protein [Rhodocyclaceae bacterium]|nr:YihY family inner membrane protein [Rhodocyclaceae bacterium]
MLLLPVRLALRVLRRFFTERGMQTAAALAFVTLLGIVPMLVTVAAVIEQLPFGVKLGEALEKFLMATLLPEKAGAVIAKYLGQFAQRAERMTWIGLTALAATALMQMLTIEHSFNALWKVRQPRPWPKRITLHFLALLLGPLAFGAALASITYLAGVSFGYFEETRWLRSVFAHGMPIVFLALLLALLYWGMPNRAVKMSHAAVGGALAALGFYGMQRLFALYVVKFPTYTIVYGAFAALPIFLIWLHLSWAIILLGALVTAELPLASSGEKKRKTGS